MRELLAEFRRGANDDRLILGGVFAIWIVIQGLLSSKGVNGLQFYSVGTNLLVYLSALAFVLAPMILTQLARHRPDRPLTFLAAYFSESGLYRRLAYGTPMLLALVIFMPAFSAMKSAIPLFNAYDWDQTWIELDRAIHGMDAWLLLQPVFGYPAITALLAVLYHLWILLIYAGGIYFCFFQREAHLRTRYLIASFAAWIVIGVAMATTFASVGPYFLAPLLGDHRFDEQIAYLREVNLHLPVLTLPVQEELLAWHRLGSHGLGRGITAMPSMHVSLAFLFFLAMRKVSKAAGLFFGLFFVVVLIGSVHLAYHYAVDGYVSVAVTWLIWLASGAVARRMVGPGNLSTSHLPAPPARTVPAFQKGGGLPSPEA